MKWYLDKDQFFLGHSELNGGCDINSTHTWFWRELLPRHGRYATTSKNQGVKAAGKSVVACVYMMVSAAYFRQLHSIRSILRFNFRARTLKQSLEWAMRCAGLGRIFATSGLHAPRRSIRWVVIMFLFFHYWCVESRTPSVVQHYRTLCSICFLNLFMDVFLFTFVCILPCVLLTNKNQHNTINRSCPHQNGHHNTKFNFRIKNK